MIAPGRVSPALRQSRRTGVGVRRSVPPPTAGAIAKSPLQSPAPNCPGRQSDVAGGPLSNVGVLVRGKLRG